MTGFINYLEDGLRYDPNPFLVDAREGNLSKSSGRSSRKDQDYTRFFNKDDIYYDHNYNFDHISSPFEKYELPEVEKDLKPLATEDSKESSKDLLRECVRRGGLFLTNRDVNEPSPPKRRGRKRRDVFERLTDHRFFTGIHRERFDEEGRGRGLAGREDLFLFDGNTESYSRPHEVYSSVLPRSKRTAEKSESARKFVLQIATPKLMWLYRNGDKHHDGMPFYLRPFIKTMETLHVEIGKELKLIAGPVRKIYDQNLRKISKLEDIVDGAKYLCTSGEPPASADKLEKFLSEWVIQKIF